MTSVLPRLPFTKRLKAAFQEFVGPNFPVGLSAIPTRPAKGDAPRLEQVPAPYYIIYPLWSTSLEGTWNEPDADVEWTYQLSAYAERGDQLELMYDKARTFMLAREAGAFVHPIDVPGIKVLNRYPKEDLGGDPEQRTGILPSDLRFGVVVTPDYDTTP